MRNIPKMTPASKVFRPLDSGAWTMLPHRQIVGFRNVFQAFGGYVKNNKSHKRDTQLYRPEKRIYFSHVRRLCPFDEKAEKQLGIIGGEGLNHARRRGITGFCYDKRQIRGILLVTLHVYQFLDRLVELPI